ncbi:protein OCTOPUS-like [Arachis stenosperma]|uniref:protein OCTOPUS-like n=1 Tax=Arachis stenosperma TaxID=217475 RepID=UPI0025AB8DCB|nr:protein OCTOPUS-like [Arachis stenosperma]
MTSKPHRLSSCHRHPTIPVNSFCASCLRERLKGIQSPSSSPSPHSHPPPHLRRTKSFSANRHHTSTSASLQPRRRSCEVRARSTLSDLFTVDGGKGKLVQKTYLDSEYLGFEIRNEEHNGEEAVRVCDPRDNEKPEETKTMKEFIELEIRNKKNGARDLKSFWEAASAFSEKLRKWKWKHKLKRRRSFGGNGNGNRNRNGNGNGVVDFNVMRFVQEPKGRKYRETQSEIGEYCSGRRSCDTDPRFSIDAGRMSLDNYPRLSCDSRLYVDEGRISVDNNSQFPDAYRRLLVDTGRISVDSDLQAKFDASWDGKQCERLSPVDRVLIEGNGIAGSSPAPTPGGSSEAKGYYKGRRSFDRSSSRRRQSTAEVNELRMVSNAKVSPATNELFYGAKLLISEKKDLDLGNENVKSLSDFKGECVMGSASKDDDLNNDVDGAGTGNHKGSKKDHKWRRVWSKFGSIVQRREEDKVKLNVQGSESVSQKLTRSYSVSCRSQCSMAGVISSLWGTETKGNINVLNGRQDFMVQRNRSVRHSPSPNNLDNGLLRFYLTPLKSYRRSKSGKSSSLKDLQQISRSVF